MTITQIKETCLYVKDLQKTIQFYQEVLELPCFSHVEGRHAFFRAGRSVLLCFNPEVTARETILPPHYAEGPQHIAFEVTSMDYNATLELLKTKGVRVTHQQTWTKGGRSFYFEDPNQHVLEIVEEGIWDN